MDILKLENTGLYFCNFSASPCKGNLTFCGLDYEDECEIAYLVDFNNMVVNKQNFLEMTGVEITKNSLELFDILQIFQKLLFSKNLLSHKNLALYQQMHR
jgi:hypothetical protein